jgi:DNA-binding NarL/FixJ family response regulator
MRLVTISLPPLLRDIITALVQDHAPVTILAQFTSRRAAVRLALLAPDVVIVGLRLGESDAIGRKYLAQIPAAKIVAISSDGRNAFVHEAPSRRTVLRGVSPQALVDALVDSKPQA